MNAIARVIGTLKGLLPRRKGLPGEWHQFFDRGRSPDDYNTTAIDRPYAQSAWVQRAIKTVADPIGSVPLEWSIGEKDFEDEQLDAFWDSPVLGLDAWPDVVSAWVGWLKLKGEAFFIVDDSWALSVPGTIPLGQLIMPRPDAMRELLLHGMLVGWEWTNYDGGKQRLLPDQVYQVKLWNPYNQWRGLGEMEAALMAAETDYLSGEYEKNLSRNSGDQGYIVTTDGGQPSKEQIDQIVTQLRRKRERLLRGEYTDLFLAGGLKVTAPVITGADTAMQASRLSKRHEIYAAFGVPPSLADVKQSYSLGKDSDYRALLVNTCIPTANRLARVVTKLGRRMTGKPVDAYCDFDDHPVMQEVRNERTTTLTALWNMGVPLREAGEYLDMQLPRVDGDDIGYLPFSVQPVGGNVDDEFSEFYQTEETEPDAVGEMMLALRSTAKPNGCACGNGDPYTRGADPRWQREMLRRKATQRAFESRIGRVLMDARKETLSRLEKYTPEEKGIVNKAVAADFVFDLKRFSDSFFKGMRAVSAQAVADAGKAVWQDLAMDDPWETPAKEVMDFTERRQNKLSAVPNDVFERIRDEIQEGFNEGDSRDEIAKRIRSQFNAITTGRSKVIAQTETSAAYGFGDHLAQKGAGVQWRMWLTSGKGNSRPSHAAADGQKVRIDEPFIVGGVPLMYPGDENGPPEEVINCFLPGTMVAGRFVAGLKASYAGKAWRIVTKKGEALSVTPNHPVLTTQGWILAKHLCKGYTLLNTRLNISDSMLRNPDYQNRETRVEDVFNALASNGTGRLQMVGALHLYGDGEFCNGNVNIVAPNLELLNSIEAGGFNSIGNGGLKPADAKLATIERGSSFDFGCAGIRPATAGSPCSPENPLKLSRVITDGIPSPLLSIGHVADWDSLRFEGAKQRGSAGSDFASELCRSHAREIALDEVVEVREFDFCGHVYDLQTDVGYLVAQNIINSNCYCTTAAIRGEDDEP